MAENDLVAETNRLVQLIDQRTRDYWPGTETRTRIGNTTFVPVIGPFAVGKNTLIDEVLALDSATHKIRSFTTRPQRPGEAADTYDFRPHNPAELEVILRTVEERRPVQADVHPSGHIYGSEAAEYEHPYSFLDIMAAAVGKVRQLKTLFKGYVEIGVVAPPEDWWPRAEKRGAEITAEEVLGRKCEAAFSLEWMLDQGPDFPIVVNRAGQLRQTAQQLLGLIKGELEMDPENRKVAEALHSSITSQLAAT